MSADDGQAAAPYVPVEQDTVPFYGHDLIAVVLPDGRIAAVLRWLCEGLSLPVQSQMRHIQGRAALAEGLVSVRVDTAGGQQTMPALTMDALPGWLFSVDERRVKTEARADVVLFQRECVKVLADHFAHKRRDLPAIAAPQLPAAPTVTGAEIAEIRSQIETLYGVANLLQEHLAGLLSLPGQVAGLNDQMGQALSMLESLAERQADTAGQVARIDERTQRLTPAHAHAVQDEIRRLVRETERLAPPQQPLTYTIIYGRLKQRFRASTYKEIADEQYPAVMAYLQDELRRALAGEGPAQGSLF